MAPAFTSRSASAAARDLAANLRNLTGGGGEDHDQEEEEEDEDEDEEEEEDVRLSSLCHGLASTLQELSLRVARMAEGETDREVRERERERERGGASVARWRRFMLAQSGDQEALRSMKMQLIT